MNILRILAEHRILPLSILFQGITLCAQESLVIVIICWFYWCRSKKLAYTLGFTYFSSGLLVQALKITFRIPRPWILDSSFTPVQSALSAATGYSFPSGHTQSGTALFSTLCFSTKKRNTKIFFILLIFAIGFSRLYLGVHTPKDVLVSAVLTLLLSLYIWKKQKYVHSDDAKTIPITICMIALCLFLLSYAYILQNQQIIPSSEARDCIKACGAGLGFAFGYLWERKWICFSPSTSGKHRIALFLIGIFVTLTLQQGLKYILGISAVADCFRYFIVVLWVIAIYPFLFTKKESHA